MAVSNSRVPSNKLHEDMFTVGDEVGKGQFGVVHVAMNKSTENLYALKFVEKKSLSKLPAWNQFKNEMSIQKGLSHENVLGLLGHYETKEHMVLVLEFGLHGTLYDLLESMKDHKLTETIAARYTRQVSNGLDYCHTKDIIHRDLKLENVILDGNLTAKLSDFGLSAFGKSTRETRCGTLDYLSPEVILDIPHNAYVDSWALGVMLYELTVGRPPFLKKGATSMLAITKVDYTIPDILSTEVKHLIEGLLQLEPKNRFNMFQVSRHLWIHKNSRIEAAAWDEFVAELEKPKNP